MAPTGAVINLIKMESTSLFYSFFFKQTAVIVCVLSLINIINMSEPRRFKSSLYKYPETDFGDPGELCSSVYFKHVSMLRM